MSVLNKIKKSPVFFLILFLTVLNSCVMYYNTNEIRTNFNKNISQINNITASLKKTLIRSCQQTEKKMMIQLH